jgi:LCP family protein required for cell wall assembly
MVIHISADRSNATVMSIPRDLMTQLPACTDTANHTSSSAQWGAISAALNYGPGCSVAAVHQLTGIPIDHFMMVDFSGVVAMSDAVGGVSVCVDNNVYDPDSHLKLSKGTHTLKGQAALEFLRTRHGFGDGSDTQRTGTQHIFLNRMINNLKSAGTLTNVPVMLKLADTATNSLTVDSGLDGATKLLGLADELNKIPSKRITFITMQTVNDTNPGESGRLLIGSGATTLFNTITNDQSLTSGSGTKSASATAKAASSSAPPVDKSTIAVQVENGTGISDRAGSVATALIAKGFSSETSATTGSSAATTTLTYPAGDSAQAKAIAAAAGLKSSALQQGTGSGYVLVIGSDWPSGTVFPGSSAAPAPADTKAALAGSNSLTGADNSKCAHVSTQLTIPTGPNTGITPEQAYADHPEVPNSAP